MKMLMKTYRSHIMWVFDSILARYIYKIERNPLEPTEKWGDYIYETLFAPVKHKKVTAHGGVFIESVANKSLVTFRGSGEPFEVPFFARFSESKPIPANIPSEFSRLAYFSSSFIDDSPHLVLRDYSVWYELRDAVIAYNEKRENAERKCTAFHNSVDGLCDYYDTVEEAVAAWPALKFLLPDWVQPQNFPFDGEPKPLPEGVDIAELTALITREKLMEV